MTTETKTILMNLKDGSKRKIIIPKDWKVTFGTLIPGGKTEVNPERGLALRVYSGSTKEQQHAVFTDVVSFRDMSIVIEEEKIETKDQTAYVEVPGEGRQAVNVEAKIRTWVNPDDPQAPRKEFVNLPRLGRAGDYPDAPAQVERAPR